MTLTPRYRALRTVVLAAVAAAWAVLLVARLGAGTPHPPVAVEQPWARPGPKGGNSAVYFVLRNQGSAPVKLVAAASEVADEVSIHETVMVGQAMRMQPVQGVSVKPGEAVTFRPGGLHVMLMGLRRALAEGDQFTVSLRFEGYEPLEVRVAVRTMGAGQPGSGMAH
ncbi:MAG TPA: copper chaperone PCu(A)C [Limnochordales bacterium]